VGRLTNSLVGSGGHFLFYLPCCSQGEDGDDADKDNDSEDEDGFFVPHGYLSEGEGCEDEEEEVRTSKGLM